MFPPLETVKYTTEHTQKMVFDHEKWDLEQY